MDINQEQDQFEKAIEFMKKVDQEKTKVASKEPKSDEEKPYDIIMDIFGGSEKKDEPSAAQKMKGLAKEFDKQFDKKMEKF